jgi:hypothetical protein
MNLSELIEKAGGRKFVLTLLAFGTATAVELLSERGITEAYAMLIAGLVGVYGASNVAITRGALSSGASEGGSEVPDTTQASAFQAETQIQLATLAASQDEIKQTVEAVAQNVAMTSQLLTAAAAQGQAAANRAALQKK